MIDSNKSPSLDKCRNRLLANCSNTDLGLLLPLLEPVELPTRKMLQARGRPIDNVYFLESGVASVVVTAGDGRSTEVALIGREGVTGMALIMGAPLSPNDTFMQVGGSGFRLSADALVEALNGSASLQHKLILYGHVLMVQMSHTALSDARFKLSERLARWLLMAQDRVEGDTLRLTHDFLATMLGIRRAGVTTALQSMQKRGIISTKRGTITILDRDSLLNEANGGYGAPEAEFERAFGSVYGNDASVSEPQLGAQS